MTYVLLDIPIVKIFSFRKSQYSLIVHYNAVQCTSHRWPRDRRHVSRRQWGRIQQNTMGKDTGKYSGAGYNKLQWGKIQQITVSRIQQSTLGNETGKYSGAGYNKLQWGKIHHITVWQDTAK